MAFTGYRKWFNNGPGTGGRRSRPAVLTTVDPFFKRLRFHETLIALIALLGVGCGTTRWTDTSRTVTEQLLISNAVDQAVTQLDFSAIEGKAVYLDPQYLDANVVDKGYLISTLRQHLLASGCLLQDDRAKAAYVVEVRSGGIGTDRHDLLFGLPSFNLPAFLILGTPGAPPQAITPEIALAKRTKQFGTSKIAVFAYNRTTGHPVWQSGVRQASGFSKHVWVLGAGPFQRGTIRDGTRFAGDPIGFESTETAESGKPRRSHTVAVTEAAIWEERRGPGVVPLAESSPPPQPASANPVVQTSGDSGQAAGPVPKVGAPGTNQSNHDRESSKPTPDQVTIQPPVPTVGPSGSRDDPSPVRE
jgi:hypothetical protein